MDLLGTKALAEFIRTEMVKYNPHVMADLEAVLALAEKSGLLVDKTDDLVDDLDALVASVPAEWQKLAKKLLEVLGDAQRTTWRISRLVQAFSEGVVVETDNLVVGGTGIMGRVTVAPREGK